MAKKNGKHTPGSPHNRTRKQAEKAERARRARIRKTGLILLIVAAVVVAGGATVTFRANQTEALRDLSDVGRGVPAVVQVHDYTCPVCMELRGEIEGIDGEFSDDRLLIRVADVHTEGGLDFARDYTSARRATLLFIDGEGNLVAEQSGAQPAEVLRRTFERHANGEL